MQIGTLNDLRDFVSGMVSAVTQWINFIGNAQIAGIHVYTLVIFAAIATIITALLYGDAD